MAEDERQYGEEWKPEVRITDSVNPYPIGTKAYYLIKDIYETTELNKAKSLPILAAEFAKTDAWVYQTISEARYRVNWLLAANYDPSDEEWVYFRADSKQDQFEYLMRRIQDQLTRGENCEYLLLIADKLTPTEKDQIVELAQKEVEIRSPYIRME